MHYLKGSEFSQETECPYFSDKKARFEEFYAVNLAAGELDGLHAEGWRRFGFYYFRPSCAQCQLCVPLRIPLEKIKIEDPKSWRRILKKNQDVKMVVKKPEFRSEIYDLYVLFQQVRYKKTKHDLTHFFHSFYMVVENRLQVEYYLIENTQENSQENSQEKLIGVSFIDSTAELLSSTYFIWHPDYASRSLGVYSVLKEMEWAKSQGMNYYYLGYALMGLSSMEYKFQFRPHELFDWNHQQWG